MNGVALCFAITGHADKNTSSANTFDRNGKFVNDV